MHNHHMERLRTARKPQNKDPTTTQDGDFDRIELRSIAPMDSNEHLVLLPRETARRQRHQGLGLAMGIKQEGQAGIHAPSFLYSCHVAGVQQQLKCNMLASPAVWHRSEASKREAKFHVANFYGNW